MIMKKSIITISLGLLLSVSAFSQSKIVLEPVGRYIYQSSQQSFKGTDHLLNANGLSDERLLIVSNSALTILNSNTMSVSGSTEYAMRSARGGGRDAAVYKDTFVYVNNHQSEGKNPSTGFGISKITADGITNIKTITETDVFFEKLNIYGDFLYAAAHNKGIRIYALTDPESPTLIASLTEGFTDVFDMALGGDSLFVADGGGGLKIVDVSDASAPKIVAGETTTTAMGTAQDIEVRDGRVYLASGGAGICVYEGGDLSSRKVYPLTGCTEDICWVGEYLAASTFSGVSVFEVGNGTLLTKVGSENTSRFNKKAYIRTAFGIGAANDSTLMVACWNSVDCYQIKPFAQSSFPDISSSAQRIRFPATGGSESHYIINQGGTTLTIDDVTTLTGDFSTTLSPESIEPGDTLFFDVTYTQGSETEGQTLFISSNDPDENPLPIQIFGNSSSLDAGEKVPDFTLSTLNANSETDASENEFTLSKQNGKVVWIQIFGTWCPACPSAEVDMQNTIVKEFANNSNVETFVLNENQQERDPLDWVQTWTSNFYQRGPMLYDADGTVGGKTFSQPNVGNMPFGRGFIIDQDGKVAKVFFGHQPQMVISTIYDLLDNYVTNTNNNIEKKDFVRVFPNPVVDDLTIELAQEYSQVTVSVYDTTGKEIKRIITDNASNINVGFADLVKGMYVLKIYTGEEVFVTKVLK